MNEKTKLTKEEKDFLKFLYNYFTIILLIIFVIVIIYYFTNKLIPTTFKFIEKVVDKVIGTTVDSATENIAKLYVSAKEFKKFRSYLENGTISSNQILPDSIIARKIKLISPSKNLFEYKVYNFFGNIEIEALPIQKQKIIYEVLLESENLNLADSINMKIFHEENMIIISPEFAGHSYKKGDDEFFQSLLVPNKNLYKWRKEFFPGIYDQDSDNYKEQFHFINAFSILKAPISVNVKIQCKENSNINIINFIGNVKIKGQFSQIQIETLVGNISLESSTSKDSKNKVSTKLGNIEVNWQSKIHGDYEITNGFVGKIIAYFPQNASYHLKAATNYMISDPKHSNSPFEFIFPFEVSIQRFIGVSIGIDLFNILGLGKVKSDIPFIESKNNINQDVNTIIGEGNNSIVLNSQIGDIFILRK